MEKQQQDTEVAPNSTLNGSSLCSYSVTQCKCNVLGNLKGPNLRKANGWERKAEF